MPRRAWLQAGAAWALAAWARPLAAEEPGTVDALVRAFMEQYQVPGLSLAFARHGQFVLQRGFGLADRDRREPVTPEHLFRIASVTKPITSAAIYTLIEQGRLKAETPIFGLGGVLAGDYGPTSPELGQLQLIQLLTHTGGGWENKGNDPMFLHRLMGQKELIARTLSHQPLTHAPGTHYAYSNFGYCLLGRVIEKITGQPYEAYVRQSILARCDVQVMRLGGSSLPVRVQGEVLYYQHGGDPYMMNLARMDSHGGWIATATDLVRFAMHVDGFTTTPNILAQPTIAAMTKGTAANPGYASGWNVNASPNWWHNGSLPGTSALLVRTASGLCWAALANTRTAGLDLALDQLMWRIAKAHPAWEA